MNSSETGFSNGYLSLISYVIQSYIRCTLFSSSCISASTSVVAENILWSLYCGCRSFLNLTFLKCHPLKTPSQHTLFLLYIYCNIYSIPFGVFSKRWQNLIFAHCSSNAISNIDDRWRLQLSEMHFLEKNLHFEGISSSLHLTI